MFTTSAVHVFATVVVQPAKVEEARAVLSGLVDDTRKEPGNLHYLLHEDPKHPGHFYFFEAYQDQGAVDAHLKSPHFAAATAKLGALLAAKPVITETKLIAGS